MEGILVPNPTETGNFLTHFGVKKRGGGTRLTTSFCPINHLTTPPPPFKLVNGKEVGDLIQQGCWMSVIDISDAYNHLKMHQTDTKWMNLSHKGKTYGWKALGFGLQGAPAAFIEVLRSGLAVHRSLRKICLVDYMDDLLIIGATREEVELETQLLVKWLSALGWTINYKKSVLAPAQIMQYLGFVWNSLEMTVSLPRDKLKGIRESIKKLLRRKQWHCTSIQSVQGMLQAALPALNCCRMKMRCLQEALLPFQKDPAKKYIVPSPFIKGEMQWWLEELRSPQPHSLLLDHQPIHTTLETDASDKGWGVVNKNTGATLRGWFPLTQHSTVRIEVKETMAAAEGLRAFALPLYNKTVLVRTDNTITLSYLHRMRGGRKPHLNKLLHKLHLQLRKRKVSVVAEYINTKDNVTADYLSRLEPTNLHASIDPAFMKAMLAPILRKLQLPFPSVDLMATSENARCLKWNSRRWHPLAHRVDTLRTTSKDYQGEHLLWANPPWKAIPKFLGWVQRQRSDTNSPSLPPVLCLVPAWRQNAWQGQARSMAREWWLIPSQKGIFLDCWSQAMAAPAWNLWLFLL